MRKQIYEIKTDVVGQYNISESSMGLVKNDLFSIFSKTERFRSSRLNVFSESFWKVSSKNFRHGFRVPELKLG